MIEPPPLSALVTAIVRKIISISSRALDSRLVVVVVGGEQIKIPKNKFNHNCHEDKMCNKNPKAADESGVSEYSVAALVNYGVVIEEQATTITTSTCNKHFYVCCSTINRRISWLNGESWQRSASGGTVCCLFRTTLLLHPSHL